uniref:Putative synapse-associated protein n=1 Tax=Corethrella appendiculata TaxID=1370023 RepID=U5ETZ9_9DIPT
MFTGFSNQVTSWIGAAKGEPQDEDVPTPPNSATQSQPEAAVAVAEPQQPIETAEDATGEEGDKKQSPTKSGVFSSVSSKMTGLFGNVSASIPSMPSIPSVSMPTVSMPSMPSIPGLRKTQTTDENGGIANEGLAASPEQTHKPVGEENQGGGGGGEDDDRSSATGGADSRPVSAPTTPTDEQAGQIGQVTHKVTAGAKSFGSFLYSNISKAGAKITETVKHNPILGEFNKEQDAFIKSQTGSGAAGVCPWVGHANEEKIKEEILSLSSDRRNFVRAPPAGVDFEFDYDISYPIAVAIMAEDKALENMRFELVPKIITEENFWRNYFYRVSLICQAGDLGTLGEANEFGGGNEVTKQSSVSCSNIKSSSSSSSCEKPINENNKSQNEFISDTFQTNDKDLEEVKAGMKKLGIDTLANDANLKTNKIENVNKTEEQWEKDLEAELQDYEVVNDGNNDKINWEKDVDELLDDETDLK